MHAGSHARTLPCGDATSPLGERAFSWLAIHAPAHSMLPGRSDSYRSGGAVVRRVAFHVWPVERSFCCSSCLRSLRGREDFAKLNGRCGALLPLFRLVGVRCIAALRRVEKPPASPQQSPVTEFLGPRKAANARSGKRPGKTGGSLTGAKCWAARYMGEGPPSTYRTK